jgi:DNA-binding NarL/FixJ family response regulator
MSEAALALAPRKTLRVVVQADDPGRRAGLCQLLSSAGHEVVASADFADVALADGERPASHGVPIVTLPIEDAGPGFDAMPERSLQNLLTPREIEVLSAIAYGLSNKAIARRLSISLHTVKFHIESLLRKLGAHSRAEAVAKGLALRRNQMLEL